MTAPTIRSSSLIGELTYSTGKTVPSLLWKMSSETVLIARSCRKGDRTPVRRDRGPVGSHVVNNGVELSAQELLRRETQHIGCCRVDKGGVAFVVYAANAFPTASRMRRYRALRCSRAASAMRPVLDDPPRVRLVAPAKENGFRQICEDWLEQPHQGRSLTASEATGAG